MFAWQLFLGAVLAVVVVKIITWFTKKPKLTTPTNKSVFITGCDSGIGNICAKRLDKIGFTVFAGCLMPEGEGAETLRKEASDRLKIVSLNITDDESVKKAAEFVKENLPSREKGLYGLINNAGVLVFGEFDWQTMKQAEGQVNVNLLGTMRVTKYFLDLIIETPGRIVNVTSINGRFSYPGLTVYCATKFGLEGFSDALRYELKKQNVKVAIIEPGDFSRVTNIMQPYINNLTSMLKDLNEKKASRYKEIIETKIAKLKAKIGKSDYDPKEANNLFNIIVSDMEDALLAENPQVRYVSAPRSFRIIFSIITKLPGELMDKVLEKAVKRASKH
ncbi:D-beta-hydroxybutyrate dehydrogenase, mitochondrial [Nymphon striatum]|nr:D-beta-hydroxybutyrate dehydrogenase, mitochondrial [Nymphon striatum]